MSSRCQLLAEPGDVLLGDLPHGGEVGGPALAERALATLLAGLALEEVDGDADDQQHKEDVHALSLRSGRNRPFLNYTVCNSFSRLGKYPIRWWRNAFPVHNHPSLEQLNSLSSQRVALPGVGEARSHHGGEGAESCRGRPDEGSLAGGSAISGVAGGVAGGGGDRARRRHGSAGGRCDHRPELLGPGRQADRRCRGTASATATGCRSTAPGAPPSRASATPQILDFYYPGTTWSEVPRQGPRAGSPPTPPPTSWSAPPPGSPCATWATGTTYPLPDIAGVKRWRLSVQDGRQRAELPHQPASLRPPPGGRARLLGDGELFARGAPLTLWTPSGGPGPTAAPCVRLRPAAGPPGPLQRPNVLSMDAYLKGVIPYEMPASWAAPRRSRRRPSPPAPTPPGRGRRTRAATTRSATPRRARSTAAWTGRTRAATRRSPPPHGRSSPTTGKPAFTQFSAEQRGLDLGRLGALPAGQRGPLRPPRREPGARLVGHRRRQPAREGLPGDRHAAPDPRGQPRRQRRVARPGLERRARRQQGRPHHERRQLPVDVRAAVELVHDRPDPDHGALQPGRPDGRSAT